MPVLTWDLLARDKGAAGNFTRLGGAVDKAAVAQERFSTAQLEANKVANRLKIAELQVAAATDRHATVAASATASVQRQTSAEIALIRANQGLAEAQAASAAAALRSSKAHKIAAGSAKAGAVATKALTVPLLALGGVAIHEAMQFEKGLTTVQIAAGRTDAQMAQSRKGLLEISRQTATGTDELTHSYYVASKAGLSVAKSLDVTKAAAQGAKAEGADLGIVTNALTSIMASYGSKLRDPVKAMNMLVRGAGLAKTTTQDYANSLSTVVPLASKAGLSFEQIGGAMATLTQHGTSAQQASQELAFAIRNLQAPNNVAISSMNQLGISAVDVSRNLGTRGLTGTFDFIASKLPKSALVYVGATKRMEAGTRDLTLMQSKMSPALALASRQFLAGSMSAKDYRATFRGLGAEGYAQGGAFLSLAAKVKGYSDTVKNGTPAQKTAVSLLKQMMGGAEGLNTWLQLTGESAGYFADSTKKVGDAAKVGGKDVLGFGEAQKTAAFKAEQMRANVHADVIELGNNLLPLFDRVVTGITGLVRWFDHLSGTSKSIIGWSVVVLAALGPILAIGSRVMRMASLANRGLQFLRNGFRSTATAAEESSIAVVAAQDRQTAGIVAASERSQVALASQRAAMRRGAMAAETSGVAGGAGGAGGVVAGGFRSRLGRGLATGAGFALGGQIAGDVVGGGASKTSWRSVAGSTLKGAGTGAGIGAAIGSFIPVVGTGVGAAVGAVVGGGIAFMKSFIGMRDAQKQAQKAAESYGKVIKSEPAVLASYAQNVLAGGKALRANNAATAQAAVARSGLVAKAQQAGLTEKDLTNAVTGSQTAFDKVVAAWRASGTASADVIGSLQRLRDQSNLGRQAAQKYADQQGFAIASEVHHARTADFLRGKLGNLNQAHLTGAQAGQVYLQGVDALTASVRNNGRTLDANTLFGRRNIAAIRTAASESLLHAQAVYQQTGSLKQADGALARDRANLMRHATQAGLSKAAVKRLVDAIYQVKDKNAKINVDTAAAQRAVSDFGTWFGSYIAGLSGKTIPLYVKTIKTGGGASKNAGVATTPHGGTVITGGGGSKPNATGTGTGGLRDGWFTVGEEGGNPNSWELGHKHGPRVDIYSNSESRRMTGWSRVPGYATGTKKAPEHHVVNGVDYASKRAADNAVARKRVAAGKALGGFERAIVGFDPDTVANAYRSLYDDAKAAHASRGALVLLSRAEKGIIADLKRRQVVTEQVSKATDHLKELQSQAAELRGTVRSAFTGTFDITQASPTLFNDRPGGGTAASILASLTSKASKAVTFSALLKRLGREGLSSTLLSQLAQAGPTAEAMNAAQALATATPKQISGINSQYGRLTKAGDTTGAMAANAVFGSQIAIANALLHGFDRRHNPAMAKAVQALANSLFGVGRQTGAGLAHGLLSQQKTAGDAAAALGREVERSLRKSLKIHSPSRVTRELGRDTALGFMLGLTDHTASIASAASDLGQAGVPNVPSGSGRGGDYHDNRRYEFTINEAEGGIDTVEKLMRRMQMAGRP